MTIAAIAAVFALLASIVPLLALRSGADAAPIGQGFTINESDLRFILQQIKISERHASETTVSDPCAGLIGTDPDQIPAGPHAVELPFGLRTIDGSCNNLVPLQNTFGQADQTFPRLVPADPSYTAASPGNFVCDDVAYAPPVGPPCTSFPLDAASPDPRTVSNLIVDQTATNPAAVTVSGAVPPLPTGTLDILNVAPDEGLSAPFNSWFTLFGQFFDHGLDLVNKGGAGAVIVPIQPGDPLHSAAPGAFNFMVLTRASGAGVNQTSPFVDQSQTYTSHPSHQVFLRDYALNGVGDPVSTGRLIEGSGPAGEAFGGMADWDRVQQQAAVELGIQLVDKDALNIPLLVTDPYGRFIPGTNGFPQIVVDTDPGPGVTLGSVEGNPAGGGVLVPANAIRTGHAFLDDIAHQAAPSGTKLPDVDAALGLTGAAASFYDDELLGRHFIAGDGRVNENIGLTSVHHVFHSEHNRLVGAEVAPAADSIRGVINASADAAFRAEWHLGLSEANPWNGERLFQAARFITEMQYQHLAFEEFARKVQPMVNVFAGYDPSINPAITAEFAHAVYRFGHSMLRETVDRTAADGTDNSNTLFDVFLNPVAFNQDGLVTLTPGQAAGQVVRGMTRQQGSEIDEFVTDVLRNALVGLPLDLPVLNIARARDTQIPRLNDVRASLYAQTGDTALAPYANWGEFGLAMKSGGASLVNFIAAYGIHPTITGTNAARRVAATALSTDPLFMAAPAATTGLDNVDLWMGGLAEAIDPFGGLLGPTFNHVFELQMERLQDGDRFYYLSRTAGLNLLVQLEGNSFAELIMRNTDVSGLPADVFSLPACIFNMDTQNYATPGFEAGLPLPECDPLSELTNGARYSGGEHIVINGQDVDGPSAIDERLWSGIGDDTIRGNGGNDWIQGGAGVDNIVGGAGDDILLDLNGDDDIKGGPGNDVISGGDGFDLLQPGTGDDFVQFGSDPTEAFGSQGDDLILGGDSFDTVFGDDGNDWIEGGGQADLLQGDNGAPFQDDPNAPGHDVIIGQGGNDDYDSEGGDDIMVAGPGIERNEGMRGYDWTTYIGDSQPADADMNFTGLQPVEQDTLRDRFDLTEGLSGYNFNDILRGDDGAAVIPLADPLENSLDAAGIARITNLAATQNPPVGFNGNIILGGDGNDILEGRGGDDILDGDRYLNVRLVQTSIPANTWGGLASIRAMLLTGALNPGDVDIVREILTATGPDTDTAVFSDVLANYEFTAVGGALVISHLGGTGIDGTDTLRNMEMAQFARDLDNDGVADVDVNGNVILAAPVSLASLLVAPTVLSTAPAGGATGVATSTSVVVTFSQDMLGVTNTTLTLRPGSVVAAAVGATVTFNPATDAATLVPTVPLLPNTTYFIVVDGGAAQIRGANGVPLVDVSFSFTTGAAPSGVPTVTLRSPAPGSTTAARNADITAQFSVNVTGVNATTMTLTRISNGNLIPGVVTYNAGTTTATLNPNGNLRRGTLYQVTLTGGPAAIRNALTPFAPLATESWLFTTAP